MARDTVKLKELIHSTLTGSTELVELLGNEDRIKHGNPLHKSEYPCVTYQIITDEDNPYNTDQPVDMVRTRLAISVFTVGTSSKLSDQLDDLVYGIINGKRLTNDEHIIYASYRLSRVPLFEPEHNIWRVESRYKLDNVLIEML